MPAVYPIKVKSVATSTESIILLQRSPTDERATNRHVGMDTMPAGCCALGTNV